MDKLKDGVERLASQERERNAIDDEWFKDYGRLYHDCFYAVDEIERIKVIVDQINPASHDIDIADLKTSITNVQEFMKMAAGDCIKTVARCQEWLNDITLHEDCKKIADQVRFSDDDWIKAVKEKV